MTKVVSADRLPFIFKKETKEMPNGNVLENRELQIQGSDLKQIKKIFDELWGENK
jgi:hypothetical protein